MRIHAALCVAAFLSAVVARADSPPEWNEFDRASSNGAFVAQVRRKLKCDRELSVFATKGGKPEGDPVWSAPYPPSGPAEGILSDDGAHFVVVSEAYHRYSPVVQVTSAAGRAASAPLGCEFAFPPAKPKRTTPPFAWLDERRPRFDDDGRTLQVTTVGGYQRWVDLGSGRLCGYASGPLRGTLSVDRRVAALGESVKFSFGLLNVSGKEVTTWHAAIWPNHRVVLLDEKDKEVPLAPFGKTARGVFGPERDKNVEWKVASGELDEQIEGDSVERHFAVEKPGRYTLHVEYVDSCDGVNVKVSSNPAEIVYFKDSLESVMDIGDRLSAAVAAGNRDSLLPLISGGTLSDDEWKALVQSDGEKSFRSLGEATFAPDEGDAILGQDQERGFRVRLEHFGGGWRIARFDLGH